MGFQASQNRGIQDTETSFTGERQTVSAANQLWARHMQVTLATLATEAPQEVLCIVRLESDANNNAQFRLTVASTDQIASASVKQIIVHHLKS